MNRRKFMQATAIASLGLTQIGRAAWAHPLADEALHALVRVIAEDHRAHDDLGARGLQLALQLDLAHEAARIVACQTRRNVHRRLEAEAPV